MERAHDGTSLADLTRSGRDDEASRIICTVLDRLHAPRNRPLPALVPLTRWFEPLYPAAAAQGGILRVAAAAASSLLATQRDIVALGICTKANVLNFGSRGWLTIDPKGLIEKGISTTPTSFVTPMGRRQPLRRPSHSSMQSRLAGHSLTPSRRGGGRRFENGTGNVARKLTNQQPRSGLTNRSASVTKQRTRHGRKGPDRTVWVIGEADRSLSHVRFSLPRNEAQSGYSDEDSPRI
jgi:hypothetical protein